MSEPTFEESVAELRRLLDEAKQLAIDTRVQAFSARIDLAEINAALDGKTLGDE